MPATIIKGIGVPFQFTQAGYPTPATDEALLQDSIVTICWTTPGERVYRPTFGSWLRMFVFENMTPVMRARARAEVFRAIREWEPRVTVTAVTVTEDQSRRIVEIAIQSVASGLATIETTLEFPV